MKQKGIRLSEPEYKTKLLEYMYLPIHSSRFPADFAKFTD